MTKAGGSNTNIQISQLALKKLLKQVEFAMAQQDIRYYLNGLLLEVNENKLNIVGTDGHRLSFTSTTLNKSYEKTDVILPRKTVIELIKLLNDSEEEISIDFNAGQVNFAFGDIKLISKVIDGKFPDYHRVIPTGHQNTFTVNRITVLTAMQRASILSNEKYRGIRMVLSNNNLKLISTNTEQEEAEEELEIDYAKDSLDIGFNVTYLIDVLNNVNDENINFSFADANSSCLITVPNDENYKYVVMPMRI
jgi:DNA polymerase-3 subunit beta